MQMGADKELFEDLSSVYLLWSLLLDQDGLKERELCYDGELYLLATDQATSRNSGWKVIQMTHGISSNAVTTAAATTACRRQRHNMQQASSTVGSRLITGPQDVDKNLPLGSILGWHKVKGCPRAVGKTTSSSSSRFDTKSKDKCSPDVNLAGGVVEWSRPSQLHLAELSSKLNARLKSYRHAIFEQLADVDRRNKLTTALRNTFGFYVGVIAFSSPNQIFTKS
ncbi:hypothetical protein NC653_001283 [Populus alba x Populus x berolinensis]|uniref:Uncharacterized protein n=1 Tax=Populus alba x Populus x berolinensis TaxID=444605 RepID=A0AAD6RL25_9ROSI|nr:hypothetical protein NC653_001283 [Populus alba x Populus x berolinensis]